jgi:hypothetical protein
MTFDKVADGIATFLPALQTLQSSPLMRSTIVIG